MIKNEVKVLSDKEHILLRPGMYIGSTTEESQDRFLFGQWTSISYVPGLIKIIDEVIDNSVDEAIRTNFKFANEISVNITEDSVTVSDNGRGIPHTAVTLQDGTSIPGPVAAWTMPKAGGNFEGDDRKTGGMNGVGSSLTNIFSVRFIGTTSDGKNKLIVNCTNGTDNVSYKSVATKEQGTKVEFTPDFSHFDVTGFDQVTQDVILDRLQTLAVVYPLITFKFNNKKIVGNFKAYAKRYAENSIVYQEDNISLAICNSEDGFRQQSYVNNIHTKNGGTHIDYIIDNIANLLMPKIKRKHKIEINKARIKESITVICFIRDMSNMRFDSQTKERFTSPIGEIKSHININFDKLATQFLANDDLINPIIESALAKKLAAERAAELKAQKNIQRAKVPKHIKANKVGNSNFDTTLFLAEGDSALGFLIETRDRDLHGGYPLKGKFKTTHGMKYVEMLKNKEVSDICSITGLVLGKNISELSVQYQNIAIVTDADHDGKGSICPSLLSFLSNWPELFHEGRVKIVQSPVWICTKGKDVKWFYDNESFESANLKGYISRYIKGLGSLERDEYEDIINKPKYHVVKLDDNWEDKFEMLYGSDSELRKLWMKA